MTDKTKMMLKQLTDKEYRNLRKDGETVCLSENYSLEEYVEKFRLQVESNSPVIYENDDFGFNISRNASIVKTGGNFTPDYGYAINNGFDTIVSRIKESMANTADEKKKKYGKIMLDCINVCLEACEGYKKAAKEQGNEKLYNALCVIPKRAATTFYEACVFIKLCIYFMRFGFIYHIGLGRFDQYMYPFYLNDKKNGVSDEEIFEITEQFFISLNFDTDLYEGMQQGDNGQSIVLGGFDKDGSSVYNELSEMCMKASLELNIIDPKINLRVGKNTPDRIYELGTLLTKQGLGFPQYCNDDVVVPGLVKLGYDRDDAVNYVVAACWEYIIPGIGADIPNIQTMDFPAAINRAIVSTLDKCDTFEKLMENVKIEIIKECEGYVSWGKTVKFNLMPMASVFMDNCVTNLVDMWDGGAKYRNFGCHGAGISNATDALAAVKENVFDKKTITKSELLNALENNFEGFSEIRNMLKASPKMGNNDDYADSIASEIMTAFSSYLNNRDNGHGGIWRAGTGSAMEYLLKGEKCPATADGRKSGEPYASSFSPSLDVKTTGILSVIQSFTKYDLSDIINGGPLTLEIHDTVLKNDIGISKAAMLVKNYILLGGHQLQFNSINRERLSDAQKHPEKYPNLIVRVWGWSGYFNELDKAYQNHIIRRTEYIQ